MRLEQLYYCMEVAHSNSMSQAAKKLFITQPSLSTAIQNLEIELGYQIFKRTNQGVVPTERGKLFMEKGKLILDTLEEIKGLAEKDAIMKHLSIAAVPAVCNILTSKLIGSIQKSSHFITLNIVELRPEKSIHSLLCGQADIVVGSYTEATKGHIFNEALKNDVVIDPIYDDQMYAFLPRNHPKARECSVCMADLADDIQVIFNDSALMQAGSQSLRPQKSQKNFYSFSDPAGIKQVVANELGYAILPYSMAYQDIYVTSGLIQVIPISDVNSPVTIYIGYKKSSRLSDEQLLVIDLVHAIYDSVREDSDRRKARENRCGSSNMVIRY